MIAENGILNPYPGPRPFEQGEQSLFFGRDREVKELLSLIIAHRVVVLYAQSGAGKTSLLNAGLAPLLIEEGFEILPVARVRGFEPEDIDLSDIANIYVFNTLVGWSEDKAEPAPLIRASILSFLKEREHLKDEFEEPLPRLAIFDQFEELFTFYPERWKEREDFFRQVVDALEADPLLRALFVMREDYLASLVSYNRLFAERLRARYRMERLRQEAATMAVEKPLSSTGRSFAEGVAASLVQELLSIHVESAPGRTVQIPGEYVEPVQLQVVCQSLWESLPADVTVINDQHLQTFGDVEEALKGFYERALEAAQSGTGVEEGDLREWFDKELITPAGTRGTVFRGEERTGKIPNSAADVLEDQHIIRAEMRAGGRWYELTHDRLIEPIRKSNEVWFQRQRAVEQQQELEAERRRAEEQRRRAEEQARIASRFRLLTAALIIISLVAIGAAVAALVQSGRAQEQAIIAKEKREEAEHAKAAEAEQRQLVQKQAIIAEEKRREAEQAKTAEAEQRQLAQKQARMAEEKREEAEQANAAEAEQRQLAQKQAIIAEEKRKEAEQAKTAEAEQRKTAEEAAREAKRQAEIAEEERKKAEQAKTAEAEQRKTAEEAAREAKRQAEIAEEERKKAEAAKAAEAEQRKNAEAAKEMEKEQRQIVLARNLATQADLGTNLPADLRVLLAVESVKMLPSSFENVQVLRERLVESANATAARMEHNGYVYSAVFSPDGRHLATISNDRTARIWGVSDGQELTGMNCESYLNSVAFSPDGKYLATACEDGFALVWEISSGQEIARMNHESGVNSVRFSPDGRYLATACEDGSALLWEVSSGKEVARMSHNYDVVSAAFSPDGSYLATVGNDRFAGIWDVPGGHRVRDIDHESRVNGVSFSPDGKYLATGDDSGIAYIWEVSTGKEVSRMVHDELVYSVAFSPDSSYLATASRDKTARIWEISGDQQVARMDHLDEVYSVCFSPDGSYLATASKDRTARIWLLLPEDLIAKARSYVNRNFTKEEWRKYLADEEYRKTWSDLPVPEE
jgi:WD40 repeat protein